MLTRTVIDMLTEKSVSVKQIDYTVIEGIAYDLGGVRRTAYVNSVYGRERLQSEVSEPYLSAVMAVWGAAPTVTEIAPQPVGTQSDE